MIRKLNKNYKKYNPYKTTCYFMSLFNQVTFVNKCVK